MRCRQTSEFFGRQAFAGGCLVRWGTGPRNWIPVQRGTRSLLSLALDLYSHASAALKLSPWHQCETTISRFVQIPLPSPLCGSAWHPGGTDYIWKHV